MPCIYIQLSYEEYKSLEEQMRTVPETDHRTVPDGGYHKAIRLEVKGGPDPLVFEFQGPVLKGFPSPVKPFLDEERIVREALKSGAAKCGFCNHFLRIPCMNTRDMEEAAEAGNRECFYQLCRAGGGERGPMSIIVLAEKRKKSP